MNYKNFNTDFFSYEGVINRKDYAINMLILIGIIIALSFLNINAIFANSSLKFLAVILSFLVSMIKFIAVFSILSLIYRRISDITYNKENKIKNIFRKSFIFIYVVPILFFYVVGFLFSDIFPFLVILIKNLMLIFFPIMLLYSIIIGFIKAK